MSDTIDQAAANQSPWWVSVNITTSWAKTILFPFNRQRLDLVLDFDNDGVSKHLGQIADSMYEWEGPVAEQLGLTPADVAAIKAKYPGELRLQT